jgi:Uma2 family endonuclease
MIAISQPQPQPQPQSSLTPAEYLAWEEQQDMRHEYDHGEITAMTGGSLPHNELALNLYTTLRPHVKAMGCRIHASDVKVQVQAFQPYYYPDLVVSCDPRNLESQKLIRYPKLIVEVLSPSTESRDRGKKFRELQRSETLEEYVLIDYESLQVECFRRSEGRFWIYEAFGPGERVRFESLDFDCPIEVIYEDVTLESGPEESGAEESGPEDELGPEA